MSTPQTKIDLQLQATPLSVAEDRWLVTNTGEEAVCVAVVVDKVTADNLLRFGQFYNRVPNTVIDFVRGHYKMLINIVHAMSNPKDPELAQVPAFLAEVTPSQVSKVAYASTPDDGGVETPTDATIVECVSPGVAAKIVYGVFDAALADAIVALWNDFIIDPKVYYSVFNKYLNKFLIYLDNIEEG